MAMGCYVMYKFTIKEMSVIHSMFHPVHTVRHAIHALANAGVSDTLWGFLFGSVFFIVGSITLYFDFCPIVFRKQERLFSKGYLRKVCVPFDNIHAIQLISDCGNDAESHMNYELNLVLNSKERINVLSHGKRKAVCHDAECLSRALGVSVWDMT